MSWITVNGSPSMAVDVANSSPSTANVTVYSALSRQTASNSVSPSSTVVSPGENIDPVPVTLHPTNIPSGSVGVQRSTLYGIPSRAVPTM